jgi:acid phosphatase (class A)
MRSAVWRAALGAVLMLAGPVLAQSPVAGYLYPKPIGFDAPPRPTEPMVLELDLVQVRAAQRAPNSGPWREAKADADAYDAPDIVQRFDKSTGRALDAATRPVLVALLAKVINDTAAYANLAKAANARPRPYVEDPAITPCETAYLQGTEQQSYPSGHAMNGYVVAIVLAKVFPEHRQAILARGVRYGDNRVVCGVHHPTDVEAGRRLGIAYFEAVQGDKAFQDDLSCAAEEEAQVSRGTALSPPCAAIRAEVLKSRASAKATPYFR